MQSSNWQSSLETNYRALSTASGNQRKLTNAHAQIVDTWSRQQVFGDVTRHGCHDCCGHCQGSTISISISYEFGASTTEIHPSERHGIRGSQGCDSAFVLQHLPTMKAAWGLSGQEIYRVIRQLNGGGYYHPVLGLQAI